MEYSIGRAKRAERGPWRTRRGNPITEIWADSSIHPTQYDIRISPNDGPFSLREGGRKAVVFDSTNSEVNGPEIRVRGLFRYKAARRAGELLVQDVNKKPSMP